MRQPGDLARQEVIVQWPQCPILRIDQLLVKLRTDQGMVHAVDGVSLTLMPGKTLGLVGESGSGKSMCGYAIMGLLPRNALIADHSEIFFQGRNLLRSNARQVRHLAGKSIAMVFQDPMTALNPVMKIGHQIAESLIQHSRIKKKEAMQCAFKLLTSVGIDRPAQRLQQYPHNLSGGLCQRVAIAIALSCNPRLLIADEPTTALDVTVQADILDLLGAHQVDQAMAMILISHDLSVVAGRAHEVAVMYAGQIVEYAPTPWLFESPRMRYSRALLDAMPRLTAAGHKDLISVAGAPPSLIDPPGGCRFSQRCPAVRHKCRTTAPPFTRINGTHYGYSCWYPLTRSKNHSMSSTRAAEG